MATVTQNRTLVSTHVLSQYPKNYNSYRTSTSIDQHNSALQQFLNYNFWQNCPFLQYNLKTIRDCIASWLNNQQDHAYKTHRWFEVVGTLHIGVIAIKSQFFNEISVFVLLIKNYNIWSEPVYC